MRILVCAHRRRSPRQRPLPPGTSQFGHADAEPLHLPLDDSLFPLQRAPLAPQALVLDLAGEDLPAALSVPQLGQGVGQAVERCAELVAWSAALGLCDSGRGDSGDEGGALDEALVALGGEEVVGDVGV